MTADSAARTAAVLPAVGQPVENPTPETVRLYATEWARFCTWCRTARQTPLPAGPATIAAYLLAMAPGLSRGALGRCRAAIGAMHRQHGLPIPRLSPQDHLTLRAAARPRPRTRAAPPSPAILTRMAAGCPRDRAGLRDRALLLLAASCGPGRQRYPAAGPQDGVPRQGAAELARTALLGLDAEHVTPTASGVTLRLRARADEAEPSRPITLTRAASASSCPVRALEDWLQASATRFGPVFRKVDRWGNVEHDRLGPDGFARIVARRAGSPKIRRSSGQVPKS